MTKEKINLKITYDKREGKELDILVKGVIFMPDFVVWAELPFDEKQFVRLSQNEIVQDEFTCGRYIYKLENKNGSV